MPCLGGVLESISVKRAPVLTSEGPDTSVGEPPEKNFPALSFKSTENKPTVPGLATWKQGLVWCERGSAGIIHSLCVPLRYVGPKACFGRMPTLISLCLAV